MIDAEPRTKRRWPTKRLATRPATRLGSNVGGGGKEESEGEWVGFLKARKVG